MAIFAREVKKGQAVILYDFTPKILVRADDTLSIIPGKIPFCEIGTMKNEKFEFHSVPVNVTFLPENQLFDIVECFVIC